MTTEEAMKFLNRNRKKLTKQQYSTIKGQILSGNIEGAVTGLCRLLNRKKVTA